VLPTSIAYSPDHVSRRRNFCVPPETMNISRLLVEHIDYSVHGKDSIIKLVTALGGRRGSLRMPVKTAAAKRKKS
jgi:hypothetical protein